MSADHRELEQLSAFLDGELDAAERSTLETHISTCERCAETLAALGATSADLRLLAEAEPSEQDSWALRGAIARARREQHAGGPRWSRVLTASGASAAMLALIVGSVVLLGGGDADDAARGERAFPAAPESDALSVPAEVEELDASFDQTAARALLGGTMDAATFNAEDGARDRGSGPEVNKAPAAGMAGEDGHADRIRGCEAALFGSDEGVERIPQRYIAARYHDVDAYFLVYHLPSAASYELWVVAQTDCDTVLLFEQRDA